MSSREKSKFVDTREAWMRLADRTQAVVPVAGILHSSVDINMCLVFKV